MTTDKPSPTQNIILGPRQMLFVYLASPLAITYMSLTGILIPLRLLELNTSPAMIGLFVGASGLLATVSAVPAGAIAEAMGPRRAYLVGAVLNGFAAAAFALIDNYWALLVIQMLRGAPHSLGWVAGQTYIMGIGRPEERAKIAGRFGASSSMLGFGGPLLMGGLAQIVGFQHSFWFVSAYCFFFAIVGLTLPEIQRPPAGSKASMLSLGYGSALNLLKIRTVKIALLLTFVRLWIGSGWQPFYIIFLQQQGFAPVLIGAVNAVNALVSSITGLQVDLLTRRVSKELVTAVGLGLGGLGVLISPYLATVPLVFLPSFLMGLGGGVSLPLVMAMLADEAGPGQRGVAMGLRTTANQAGGMLAPLAVGLIISPIGIETGFALNAVAIWVMLGAAMLLHRTTKRPAVAQVITQPTG